MQAKNHTLISFLSLYRWPKSRFTIKIFPSFATTLLLYYWSGLLIVTGAGVVIQLLFGTSFFNPNWSGAIVYSLVMTFVLLPFPLSHSKASSFLMGAIICLVAGLTILLTNECFNCSDIIREVESEPLFNATKEELIIYIYTVRGQAMKTQGAIFILCTGISLFIAAIFYMRNQRAFHQK
jgi:hypothetical protein